jgi:hypothetical protein
MGTLSDWSGRRTNEVSDNAFYLWIFVTFAAFIALLTIGLSKERTGATLNEGYLKATKSFQVRCENDGFIVLNETLYRCSKVTEVPSIDLELGE